MPRKSVSVTHEFHLAVESYRQQRGLPSWSAALVELAAAALGFPQERASRPWGGDRKTVPDPDAPYPTEDPRKEV